MQLKHEEHSAKDVARKLSYNERMTFEKKAEDEVENRAFVAWKWGGI